MRKAYTTLLFLCISGGNVSANRAATSHRLDLLKREVSKVMDNSLELKGKISWQHDGVPIDQYIEHMRVHEPDRYAKHRKRWLLTRLEIREGGVVYDVDPLDIQISAYERIVREQSLEPDPEEVVTAVLAIATIRSKLRRVKGGVYADEILVDVKSLHPHIHRLYGKVFRAHTDDRMLLALEQMLDRTDSITASEDSDGRKKYFWTEE